MSDIYEQLKEIFGEREEEGLSTMALVSLPRPVRILVQLMLRNRGEMAYPDLVEAMNSEPEDKRMNQAQVDEVLDAMTRLGLMIPSEKKKTTYYKIHLGSSVTGTRAPTRPTSKKAAEARERADKVWDTMSEEPSKKRSGNIIRRIFGRRNRQSD
jgi:hypothetical protein